jgi:NADH-quinone oxidoreductase subunit L
VIGAITALFMGFLGLIQNDIKRVIAYSTLSQLGYMTVALGVSAYSAAIFHLFTHAFFKALLFLAAGSVILALHHQQDIRQMGGLKKYLPITYWTSLIGTLALIGFPGLAGFFSKDAIIMAVHESTIPGSSFALWAVMIGVFVTSLYSFRLLFLVFHGKERFDAHGHPPHESPGVVTWPLILLAIPSVLAGYLIGSLVYDNFFSDAITVMPQHDVLAAAHYHGLIGFISHGLMTAPFWLAMAGLVTAWYLYLKRPDLPAKIQHRLMWLWQILDNKYGFDAFNDRVFAGGSRGLGWLFSRVGDRMLIDGLVVNGTARTVGLISRVGRKMQSGYLYHYAFVMIIGVWLLLTWFVV